MSVKKISLTNDGRRFSPQECFVVVAFDVAIIIDHF